MAEKQINVIKVFVGSPGNTKEERQIINQVVSDFNKNYGNDASIQINLLLWEEDAYPGIGSYPQDVINKQIPDYDIFIGLMSTKFGSPTPKARSGTEEEFDRAIEKHYRFKDKSNIMFYFKNSSIKMLEIDPDELLQIHRFRKKVGDLGVLYYIYETTDDFRRMFNSHLYKQIKYLMSKGSEISSLETEKNKTRSTIINLPDWIGTQKIVNPQWADYFEIRLDKYIYQEYKLTGNFSAHSEYIRFGFKLLPIRSDPFGDGSIQSRNSNLIVHIGKNFNTTDLFITTYTNGIRSEKDLIIDTYDRNKSLPITLSVNTNNILEFIVNNKKAHQARIPADIKDRLLIMAWGDEHEFKMEFNQIHLELFS